MPEVIWLPEAVADVERLYRFLADKNPQAARNAALCIQAAARQLETFPEIGRPFLTCASVPQSTSRTGSGAPLRASTRPITTASG
jgi:plasmid stabilization system protein ParE